VDRGTKVFWALIAALLGASLFFGVNVERRRRLIHPAAELHDGDLVTVTRVVDGDTLVVTTESNASATVELLGIETFDATRRFDDAARFGSLATDELRRLAQGQSVRVMLHGPPRDKRGAHLAHLYVGETDIGLELVKQGLALTYSVYPFPSMSLYAEDQAEARAQRRGLWADDKVAKRAGLLELQWRREKR